MLNYWKVRSNTTDCEQEAVDDIGDMSVDKVLSARTLLSVVTVTFDCEAHSFLISSTPSHTVAIFCVMTKGW